MATAMYSILDASLRSIWWCYLYSSNRVNPYRWPRGLRRGSAAARFLGSRVRIPLTARLSHVIVACYQVEVFATARSFVQTIPTEFVSVRARAIECE
jgi:hypothetical protein